MSAAMPMYMGVPRIGIKSLHGRLLQDRAGIHDHYAVRDAGDNAQIMRYLDNRHAQFPAKPPDQFDDLRLDGDVERGRRLIGYKNLGVAGERDGNHHPLAHSSGKLVRIVVYPLRRLWDAHEFEKLNRPRLRCLLFQTKVLPQRLNQLIADGKHGIERCYWILKNKANVTASNLAQFLLIKFQKVFAVQLRRSRDNLGRRHGKQFHQRHHRDAFAGAAFADNSEKFPRF